MVMEKGGNGVITYTQATLPLGVLACCAILFLFFSLNSYSLFWLLYPLPNRAGCYQLLPQQLLNQHSIIVKKLCIST